MSNKRKKLKKKSSGVCKLPSQRLQIIDKLLERGGFNKALKNINSALKIFPKHGGLLKRRVEALMEIEQNIKAEMAAYQWTKACPGSIQAWSQLYALSMSHRRAALAVDASHHFNELAEQAGETLISTLSDDDLTGKILSPYTETPVTARDLKLMDISLLCVESQHYEEGVKYLQECTDPPARNNLGICLFQAGHFEEALQCFTENWEQEPRNLLALSWIARLRLFIGEKDRALGLAATLINSEVVRIEDAIAQVTGLIFLGKEKEALQAQQEISHQPWWDESTQVASYALLKHFAAVCHARTGDIAQAKSLWNEALEQHPDLEVAEQNLQDIRMPASERNGVWPLSLYELIPSRWLDKIRQGQSERATIDITKPLSNSYIERICQLGDKTTITLGETLLLKRFEGGDLETKPILIALLEGRQGNYKERFSFSSQLLEAGVIDRQDPINLWDGEQPQKIQVKGNLINNKPKPTTLTLKQQSKMAEALDAFRNGDIPCAKRILKKLCDETNDASAWGNFAATYEKTGDHKKAEMLMKRAVKVDPDYLMGRCNLAMFYIRRGDTDKAKELLEGLLDTEQLHIQEAITLYGAYAVLSAREGDLDRANTLLDSVQEMAEDYDETDRLQMYRNMVDVPLLDKFTGLFSRLAKGAEND